MRTYKTQAIILKRIDIGEADKIISVFTPSYGKISIYARGIKRPMSRRSPHVEVFAYSQLQMYKGKTMDTLVDAQTIKAFSTLRQDLRRMTTAFRMAEMIERLCPQEQENHHLFKLFLTALTFLDDCTFTNLENLYESFSLRLLWNLGFLPRDERPNIISLDQYIETIMEKKMKSKTLL